MSAKAASKSAGIVIDDAAVTPRYVVGFTADRELPIIGKIAWGSALNKLIFLLPGALLLSTIAPWSILPLLILGGAYLCYEDWQGAASCLWLNRPKKRLRHYKQSTQKCLNGRRSQARSARLYLVAEIMAITLAAVGEASLAMKAIVLAVVGMGITIAVYGTVALIVKADDFGVALASRNRPWSAIGRGIVHTMPWVLSSLSLIGTLAMLWVGGGIFCTVLLNMGSAGRSIGSRASVHRQDR